MIFIYPASVSENCDRRIVPAVAKCIERFFLFQLQDAIASGVLPLSRKWDGRNYGPILLECLNNYNKKQMLTESSYLTEDMSQEEYNENRNRREEEREKREADKYRWEQGNRNEREKREKESHDWERDQNRDRNAREAEKHGWDRDRNSREAEKHGWDKDRNSRDAEKHDWDRQRNERENQRNAREQDEYERRKRYEEEEKARNASMHKTGSYTPMDSKIDIVPTSGTVQTNVLYKGGTLNGKSMEEVDFNISVKVIPTILKNFKVLEKDLLDDYFSKKSESAFKSRGRNVARAAYNVLKRLPFGLGDALWKVGMTIAGEDTERESRKDIIYNSQGFVNASAFHKSGSSPNNYNFTSNIVIFNKDDLTDPDDANMFENRSAMVRLFKMGWSTFCMLDPVEEMMYFISSLDGGFMHYIPYRYMMESYGSRSYYGTESKLKDSAKPFLIKRGNFAAFAKVFKKKSRK